jgi:hypothetical protein
MDMVVVQNCGKSIDVELGGSSFISHCSPVKNSYNIGLNFNKFLNLQKK